MKKIWGIVITVLLLILVIINAFILFEYLEHLKSEEQKECCCCRCCDDLCNTGDTEAGGTGEEDTQKEVSSYKDDGNAPALRGYTAYVLSKTTSDLSKISNIETSGDIQENSEFSIAVTQDSDEVLEQIAYIYEYVSGNDAAPVKYFSEDIGEKIAELLPEGTVLEDLRMNEFITVETFGCDEGYDQGRALVGFELATKYEDTQYAVALVGIFTGRDSDGKLVVEWIPLKTEIKDGGLEVEFDLETLKKMNDNKCAFAVLSTPTV